MNSKSLILFLLAALLISTSGIVLADEEDDKPQRVLPQEEATEDTIEDFEKKMEEESSAASVAKSLEEKMPEPLSEEQSKQISDYFEEASNNYREILDGRPEAEVRNLENRIGQNQMLLEENRSKLSHSEAELRKIKLVYIRQFLVVKNAYKKGYIDKATYNTRLQKLAKEYEFKVQGTASDVDFYQGEFTKTKTRLGKLNESNRINKILINQQLGGRKKQAKQRPLTELEKMMQRLQSIGCFEAKDVWTAKDRK